MKDDLRDRSVLVKDFLAARANEYFQCPVIIKLDPYLAFFRSFPVEESIPWFIIIVPKMVISFASRFVASCIVAEP